MDSMTEEEMTNPRIIGSSRIKRISIGAGSAPETVRELLKYHKQMQNAMKGMRGGKFNMKKMMKKQMKKRRKQQQNKKKMQPKKKK